MSRPARFASRINRNPERDAPLSGVIVVWEADRNFGFVEFEGQRVFLHAREFAERHKRPEVGDRIAFGVGQDAHGRVCATRARHVDDGGRLRAVHFLILAGLLAAPGWALAQESAGLPVAGIVGYALLVSVLTFAAYGFDKRRARAGGWRVPEHSLHALEALGGWPGAFLAQRKLRHKTTKTTFQLVFWLIVAGYQCVAIDRASDGELRAGLRRVFDGADETRARP